MFADTFHTLFIISDGPNQYISIIVLTETIVSYNLKISWLIDYLILESVKSMIT